MTAKKVFITGATGYIGGEVLYKLLSDTDSEYEITALVRSPSKSDNLVSRTNGKVKTIIGNLDDGKLIAKFALESDIIINTANVDHVPSATILSEVLIKKTSRTILIHTSGTSVLQDPISSTKGPSDKIYSDLHNNDEINNLSEDQPHRPVDKIILAIQDQNPKYIKTVIIAPPTIFGFSNGYDNTISVQVPTLIKICIKVGQPVTIYSGNYYWSHVHVTDLADLYILLLHKLLSNQDIPTGTKGYYFATGGTDHLWSDVSKRIGKNLVDLKITRNKEVKHLTSEEAAKALNWEFAPYFWGTNSRSKADLSRKIGWVPKLSSDEAFWDDVDKLTETIATKHN